MLREAGFTKVDVTGRSGDYGIDRVDILRVNFVSFKVVFWCKRFLTSRRAALKSPCGPGKFYCFRCREPREPALGMADYLPFDDALGNLSALCPVCATVMNKRASLARLGVVAARMEVAFPMGRTRLNESSDPSLNRDFGKDR